MGHSHQGFGAHSLPLGDRRCDSRGVMDANVGLGYQALSWLQPEVELNYLHEFVKGGDDSDQIAATAGFVICAGDNVELRVGVQQAPAGRNTDKGTSFICAVSFCWQYAHQSPGASARQMPFALVLLLALAPGLWCALPSIPSWASTFEDEEKLVHVVDIPPTRRVGFVFL